MTKKTTQRLVFIDALKALASQLIILHHLAFYGPMSDSAAELIPQTVDWLSQYARIAVQIFLVVGGFLAVKGLAPHGISRVENPLRMIWQRYARLVLPMATALCLAIVCAAVARNWMDHDSIPDVPTLKQFAAHAALLHNILDVDALSAGVWYVAIDFQLFSLLVLVFWGGRYFCAYAGMALAGLLAVASLFYFNRDADWDIWALYFLGSYGMGAVACWAANRYRATLWLGVMTVVVVAALVLDFRLRIAVALVTALALGIASASGLMSRWPDFKVLAYLAKISYSVFLVHFPVCLVVNAAFVHWAPDTAWVGALGMGVAWASSLAVGAVFYRYVESRTGQVLAMVEQGGRVVGGWLSVDRWRDAEDGEGAVQKS